MRTTFAFIAVWVLLTAGCGGGNQGGSKPADSRGVVMNLQVTSSAFANGQPIPRKYTGEGEDVSPPLSWSSAPAAAKELALICDDPDAPQPEPWVHWVIYKIPAQTNGLSEAVPKEKGLREPAGAMQGINSFRKIGYGGPMPPRGHGMHHYRFRLYALKQPLDAQPGIDKRALLTAMRGSVIAEGELVGTYERK